MGQERVGRLFRQLVIGFEFFGPSEYRCTKLYVYINEQASLINEQALLILGGSWIRRRGDVRGPFCKYLEILVVFNQIRNVFHVVVGPFPTQRTFM